MPAKVQIPSSSAFYLLQNDWTACLIQLCLVKGLIAIITLFVLNSQNVVWYNYTLVPNWQLWGLKSAVYIHTVGTVAALPALPCAPESCTSIPPASVEGFTAYSYFCYSRAGPQLVVPSPPAGHLWCSRGIFLTKPGNLNRSPSGDERRVEERAACGRREGRGAQLRPPPLPASSLQPSRSQRSGAAAVGQLKAVRARVSWGKQ